MWSVEVVGQRAPHCDKSVKGTDAFARVAAVNAYYVCGVLFAAWAVILSFVGITRETSPPHPEPSGRLRVVSVLLAVATIGSAIYTGATEDKDEGGSHDQALVLRIRDRVTGIDDGHAFTTPQSSAASRCTDHESKSSARSWRCSN